MASCANKKTRRGRFTSFMSRMVRVPGQDCQGPVGLLRQEQQGKLVGKRHRAERDLLNAPLSGKVGPTVRGPDREEQLLCSLIALLLKVLGEGRRGELAPPGLQRYQPGRDPRGTTRKSLQQCVLRAEAF